MNAGNPTYEIILQEDEETGDLIMPLPQELLDRVGWKEGDELEWKQAKDGAWVLSKVVK